MATVTTNARIPKPQVGDAGPGYATTLIATIDALDATGAVGSLAVATAESPSATLNVRVSAGSFRASDGTLVSYAGTTSFALTASSTNSVYLSNAGTLTKATTGYPAATDLVRLATVVTGTAAITSIVDDRAPYQSFGAASSGAPANATYIVQTANGTLSAEQALSSLTTGLVKVTTTTGVLSTAVAGTDYLAPSGSGASLTALNATQLTTGTAPTARLGSGTASSSTYLRGDQTWATPSGSGDTSTNTATSVDSEVVLFSGTTGKLLKRSTATGIPKLTAGVQGTAAAGTDYVAPTGSGSGLTSLNASNLASGTVATARLGTGTADATTFLRGDNTWTAPTAGITVQDEGTPLTTAGTTLNFVGSGVVASGTGATKTITISSGGITTAGWTMDDGANIAIGSGTGTKLGTGTSQKLGFFNATPVIQPIGSSDVLASLIALGLRASGANPSFNMGTGDLYCGTIDVSSRISFADGANILCGSTTGTRISNTSAGKIGFWGVTPVGQPAGSSDILQSLADAGLRGTSSNPPLDMGTGALTCGTVTIANGNNIVVSGTTGTKIGTATTQKLSFYNATPVVQPTAVADATDAASAITQLNALLSRLRTLGLLAP